MTDVSITDFTEVTSPSGSSEVTLIQVQVLLPAPSESLENITFLRLFSFLDLLAGALPLDLFFLHCLFDVSKIGCSFLPRTADFSAPAE